MNAFKRSPKPLRSRSINFFSERWYAGTCRRKNGFSELSNDHLNAHISQTMSFHEFKILLNITHPFLPNILLHVTNSMTFVGLSFGCVWYLRKTIRMFSSLHILYAKSFHMSSVIFIDWNGSPSESRTHAPHIMELSLGLEPKFLLLHCFTLNYLSKVCYSTNWVMGEFEISWFNYIKKKKICKHSIDFKIIYLRICWLQPWVLRHKWSPERDSNPHVLSYSWFWVSNVFLFHHLARFTFKSNYIKKSSLCLFSIHVDHTKS